METEQLVILVDDDPVCQSIVQTCVESLGFTFMGFYNGKEVLATVAKLQPALVLLDVGLPDISGFDLCTDLQNSPETASIPILFLTIIDAPENVEKAFQRGARDYITKPFQSKELQARIRAHVDLSRSLRELERETLIKQKLFSLISHDLRSPFSSIIGVMQLLLTEYDTMNANDRRDFLQALLDNSLQQLQLLDNLMYWSRGQSERIVAQIQRLPVAALLKDVTRELADMASHKGIALHIDISPDVEILADPDLFRMILKNLIHNALKFSPPGVPVRISAPENTPAQGLVNILIEDSGTGIPGGEAVFSSVSFISTPGTGGERGSGIGLKICQALAKKQDGVIRLLKSDSSGTILSLCMPRA